MSNLPKVNDVVVFSVIPTASYLTVGEKYRVTHAGRRYNFTSIERGSSTSDARWAVKRAEWTLAT